MEETFTSSETIVSFADEEKALARVLFNGNSDAKHLVQMLNERGMHIQEFQDFSAKSSNKKQMADIFFDKISTSYNLYISHTLANFLSCYLERF
jgi:hypothetical protein